MKYLRLLSKLNASFRPALDEVVQAWNRAGARIVFWPPGLSATSEVVTVQMAPSNHFMVDWVGHYDARTKVILLNDGIHWTTKPRAWMFWRSMQMDPRLAIAHEIGHALGLKHREGDSIMNADYVRFNKWGPIPAIDHVSDPGK